MKTRYALAITVVLTQPLPWALRATPALASETGALEVKEPEGAIVGEWLSEDREGRIRFEKAQDGTYIGVVSWSAVPTKDSKNPDPKLRDRSTVGTVIIWNLRYDGGEYVGGYCYNPRDGNTYRMKTEVIGPETMKVRGYLAVPLLGQTQKWTRYH
jgi:uncharacterized protein (DUF2147 family)